MSRASRNRAGETAGFTFDNLSRLTLKDLPGSEPDVSYGHDLLGRLTSASQPGHALSFTYDALGHNLTQVGPQGTVTSTYDLAGRRTRIAHPDGFFVDEDHLVTGETSAVRENGATSGIGVLATFGYDDLGRRTGVARGNGTVTSYGYDPVSRLASLAQDVASAHDLTLTFSHMPSSQIASATRSNDAYAWTGHGSGTTGSTANGLNQLTAIGGAATSHDARGNMTADGLGKAFGYTSENLLTSATGGVTLGYDPAMRLTQVTGAATTRFGYDGADLIAEYNGSNALQRRYVHGPGTDEPLVWYEGSGTSDRRFLHADERGSVVAVSNGSGSVTNVNTYDEYGKPGSGNVGRFQYTGQKWIGEIGLYDYKARMYHPEGRFMQADPIGYGDGMNIYAYVGNDPVNLTDPSGLETNPPRQPPRPRCTGSRISGACGGGGIAGGLSGFSTAGVGGQAPSPGEGTGTGGGWVKISKPTYTEGDAIVVTAAKYVWVSSGLGFYFNGSRYVKNPYYQKSKYSDRLDLATGVLFSGPVLVIGGAEALSLGVGGITLSDALFARGIGLLNSNNVLRFGQGWKGSAASGRSLYRVGIGHRSWPTIPGAKPFPWHLP